MVDAEEPLRPGDLMVAAEQYRSTFLAITLSAPMILDPSKPIVEWNRFYTGITPPDSIPLTLGGRGDLDLVLDLNSVIDDVLQHNSSELVQDLLAMGMVLSATKIGELIDRGDFRNNESPLLQFARHYRNACAHNRRWSFKSHEPAHPAALRDLEIDNSLHGRIAPYGTVSPADHLYFLDDISAYFATMSLRKACDEVQESAAGSHVDEIEAMLWMALQKQGVPENSISLSPDLYASLAAGWRLQPSVSSRTYS